MRDFQTAPYEALCGCVCVDIPGDSKHMFAKGANPAFAEKLIREGEGKRTVRSYCTRCSGTGLKPVVGQNVRVRTYGVSNRYGIITTISDCGRYVVVRKRGGGEIRCRIEDCHTRGEVKTVESCP